MKLEGYHATVEHTRNILDNNNLKPKIMNYKALPGDLGTGTYFFKDNPELAKKFLEKMRPIRNIKIIKCTIEVDDNEVLDFNDLESQKFFNEFKALQLEKAKETFKRLKGKRACIDGIVMNLLVKTIKEKHGVSIKLIIKDTYTPTLDYSIEDKLLISNFPNGTELCVVDHRIVKKGEIYNGV